MRKSLFMVILLISLCACFSPARGDVDSNSSADLTPQQTAYVKEINQVLIVEIQKGVDELKKKNFKSALVHFIGATDIAPYDPMAYRLLIEILTHADQEDLAYQILEKAGRNNTDNDIIIKEMAEHLKEIYGEEPVEELPRISIAQFRNNKTCAVSFIFDDGEPSVATAILPMFEEYGWRTTIAINPGMIPASENDPNRAGWGAWRRALTGGHEIANHGMNHIALINSSNATLKEEILASRNEITKRLGIAPRSFIFPEDKVDAESTKAAQQTHVAIRDHETLRKLYSRICIPVFGGKYFSTESGRLMLEIAMNRKLWLIPECHGLYSPYIKKSFKAISPEFLQEQLEFMHKHSDKIWVAKFITVFSYLTERKMTTLQVLKSEDRRIEFELTHTLDRTKFFSRLTVVINPKPDAPKTVKAVLKSTETWIPASIKNGLILINVLPNSGPVDVQWE